ncbi:hypothetical protein EJ08DRAFT_696180 [Tothia fuscella]|uniref:Uncharacterized protein n=1 Tax=Tothia fuscella TaxID=1048955 RepID=A0A9P4NU48_9PEZI|nr:hypothetical protein EJ08DRAFT_696180 [Tothia fuscella]
MVSTWSQQKNNKADGTLQNEETPDRTLNWLEQVVSADGTSEAGVPENETPMLDHIETASNVDTNTSDMSIDMDFNQLVNYVGSKLVVTLRYDPSKSTASVQKLTSPIGNSKSENAAMKKLVSACQPATFGLNGKDVYDETYRKAIKLEVEQSSTDFCPYAAGIIDEISQSSSSPNTIRWATFYSDCKHEVLEVTDGHRITLTYNLFSVNTGLLAGQSKLLNVKKFPAYDAVKALVKHSYFVGDDNMILGGSDMVIYEVFRALGVHVVVRPILSPRDDDGWGGEGDTLGCNEAGRVVGDELYVLRTTEEIEDWGEVWASAWGGQVRDITWLTNMGGEEDVAVAYVAHGNQPTVNFFYSKAAILASARPF